MRGSRLGKAAFIFFTAGLAILVIGASALAAPGGTGPNDPLMIPTGSSSIAPGTTLWFYFDYAVDNMGGGFGRGSAPRLNGPSAQVKVAVDANGAPGLALAIYTPDQASAWVNDPTTAPVGRGTPYTDTSNDLVTHDLYWAGAFNASGRYLIAVSNSASVPVAFEMTVSGDWVTLYPPVIPSPTPTLPVPFTVTPVPTGTIQGKIVFETATGGDIYTVNGDGSQLTRVSRGIDPSWSPDGKKIFFARWDNADPGIYTANSDGSNEQLVFGTRKPRKISTTGFLWATWCRKSRTCISPWPSVAMDFS